VRTAEEAVRRVRPRPDPLPVGRLVAWHAHAPWILVLAGIAGSLLVLENRDLGLAACGAGWALVLASAARVSLRAFCRAAHLAGGVMALGALRGAEEAGAFVPAAGALAVASLLAQSFAELVRTEVAPLAGRLPWIVPASLRGAAVRFGVAGLAVGVPLAFLGGSPVLRAVGVAMVPLALRSYLLSLLGERVARAIWCLAVSIELLLLTALVAAHGATGAAWAAVVAEAVLFGCSAFVVARKTGVAPLPQLQLVGLACVMVLVLVLTLRGDADFLLLGGIALGVAAGALFWPRK
jgi:hypothetical protein